MIYDIAVVGAGPAAATFARCILRGNPAAALLLIDGQDEKHKKPCGGLLAPDSQKALAHFDLTLPKQVLVDPPDLYGADHRPGQPAGALLSAVLPEYGPLCV